MTAAADASANHRSAVILKKLEKDAEINVLKTERNTEEKG